MTTKTCTSCGVRYPAALVFFFKEVRGKYGLRGKCKVCFGEYSKELKASPEGMERTRKSNRKHYAANKEKYAERYKKYYQENIEYHRNRASEYAKNNRDKGRERDARRRKDPHYRVHANMSRSIRQSLFRFNGKGGAPWEELVGYTKHDLAAHLERQFLPGMSWDNYGEWHIDHVVPQAAFNFSSPDHIDFKRCWALENLQPLWATDNISKNARLDRPFQPSLQM